MPFGFRLTADTLPSPTCVGACEALPPLSWIWSPPSGNQRDFNPPDPCAAQRTLCPLLTPASPSPHLTMMVAPTADRQASPGNAHPPTPVCPPHLHPRPPCRYRTLKISAFSSGHECLYAVSVRRARALPAAFFGSHLAMGTLAVRLTVPPAGSVEDFNLQVSAPCRAHKQKGGPHSQATSFGVYYPHLSATSLNNRKTLILHLNYDLSIYYKNLPRKTLFYSPYSKKQFVV